MEVEYIIATGSGLQDLKIAISEKSEARVGTRWSASLIHRKWDSIFDVFTSQPLKDSLVTNALVFCNPTCSLSFTLFFAKNELAAVKVWDEPHVPKSKPTEAQVRCPVDAGPFVLETMKVIAPTEKENFIMESFLTNPSCYDEINEIPNYKMGT